MESIIDFSKYDTWEYQDFMRNPRKFDYLLFDGENTLCPRCKDSILEVDEVICSSCQEEFEIDY